MRYFAENPTALHLTVSAVAVREVLEYLGFFAPDDLPEPFVPIHAIRIKDAASVDVAAHIR
jgi:hypothetical protein